MGIGFVLLIWLVVGTFVAGMGAAGLGAVTAIFTNGVRTGRRRVVLAATFFPIACLVWGGTVFVFQWVVNESVLHRDPGLGDEAKCPLPNGYALLMIDTGDQGWIYNPKTQPTSYGVSEQADAVGGVRTLQVTGRYVLGARDTKSFEHFGKETDEVDSYFLLDTSTGKRGEFPNYEALSDATIQLGVQPSLRPIYAVYTKYRYTAFDAFAGLLLFLPPLVSGLFLIRWIRRLRKTLEPTAAQA